MNTYTQPAWGLVICDNANENSDSSSNLNSRSFRGNVPNSEIDDYDCDHSSVRYFKSFVLGVDAHSLAGAYQFRLKAMQVFRVVDPLAPPLDACGAFAEPSSILPSLPAEAVDFLRTALQKAEESDVKFVHLFEGFSAAKFHEACDGVPHTVTICETTDGYYGRIHGR